MHRKLIGGTQRSWDRECGYGPAPESYLDNNKKPPEQVESVKIARLHAMHKRLCKSYPHSIWHDR